jgi:alcohol dehydrogenase
MIDDLGLERSLTSLGITRDILPTLAEEAAGQWTASFNPRPGTAADFLELYQAAFHVCSNTGE